MEKTILNSEGEREELNAEQTNQELAITTAGAELSPLNIIRTETVISRLPIHNLAKKGRVNIQIVRKTAKGEIDLKWEVSYSDRHGQPRQLAYKLDTIIINRKFDELSRPLPEIICLGSLREIAHKLDLGGNTNKVRLALRQNAFASITAKLKYNGNDGSERTLEADFTRYSVVFTGEKLPDGRRADAVYILLNPPYREVLNNAPVRPLDYDYLKQLPPAAQRFYEIVSRKIFAAIKYDHPQAKLAYSEFCTFSAQQRQLDYDHFKKQMYKVHRPHIKSGYITKVAYEMCTDGEGKRDWLMLYTPGPKAHAEFQTFNGLPAKPRRTRTRKIPASAASGAIETKAVPDEALDRAPSRPEQTPGKDAVDQKLLAELTACGIFESEAVKLLTGASPEQLDRVGDYIDYWYLIPGDKKTPGLLHSLIKRGDLLPPTFETRRQRADREAAERRRQNLLRVKNLLHDRYEEYRYLAVDQFIAEQLPPGELERRVADQKTRDSRQQGLWNTGMNQQLADTLAHQAVRKEIADQVSLLPYEEFRKSELPKILAELQITTAELGIELPTSAGNGPASADPVNTDPTPTAA